MNRTLAMGQDELSGARKLVEAPFGRALARLGQDLRAALADMIAHRGIRQVGRAVLIDQPCQNPSRRMPLLSRGIHIRSQHRVDRGDVRRVARQDGPPERPDSVAEERRDIGRDEAGVCKRVLDARP